jgi:RNA polymerase sigma-70 factor (ECF subfamily)
MNDSTPSLEAEIRSGNADALVEYLEQQRPRLRVYIERNMSVALRQKIDADDLMQEVVMSCLQAQAEVDLTERDLFGWVCQMAQRRIVDAGRKFTGAKKRDASREVSLHGGGASGSEEGQQGIIHMLIASVTSPSRAFSRNQKEFHLLAALDELPEDQREALKLRYIDALPTKEIAEKMGKTDGAIRVMLTRSLKRLGDIMEGFDEFTHRSE